MSLLLLAACAGETPSVADAPSAAESSPPPSASVSAAPGEPAGRRTSTPPSEAAVAAADRRLVRDLVSFATRPSATTVARLPLADEVALGLGRDILGTLGGSAASDPSAWVLRARSFRAYEGPFSALDLIRRHAEESGSDAVDDRGAFRVSVGDHPHCASPPVPAPRAFAHHRRVSVQPAAGSVDSCLSWFTVDLFLDGHGEVAAVTLDIWEP